MPWIRRLLASAALPKVIKPGPSVRWKSMVSRVLSRLVPVRVTVAYTTALFVVASALLVLGPRVQDRVAGPLSTNLQPGAAVATRRWSSTAPPAYECLAPRGMSRSRSRNRCSTPPPSATNRHGWLL
jgi:hypothetical protein